MNSNEIKQIIKKPEYNFLREKPLGNNIILLGLGGSCGFMNNYSESFVDQGEWRIDVDRLPDKYKKYAAEIDEVFNANVEYGCCGGCL
jgi:hypothetical protein